MNPFKTPHLRFVLTEPQLSLTISDHNLLLIVKINKVIPPEKKKLLLFKRSCLTRLSLISN